jgi:hypothetical protein
MMMLDRINDIAWQASQGSVAAIIQILNQKLADSGVRTRAVFADGVLQLLCEARTLESLEKSTLVTQVHQILESIAPRNIRRVNINSRIVREEQLLWLEEINRDRENQLIWSEEIELEQPSFFQQIIKDFKEKKPESVSASLPKTQSSFPTVVANSNKQKKSLWGWMLIIPSSCLVLLTISWAIATLVGVRPKNLLEVETAKSLPSTTKSLQSANNNEIKPKVPIQINSIQNDDPFADAVRIANQISGSGKKATNSTQWLEIAASWQRASDLMSKVPSNHSRYKEAQIRTKLYRQYSSAAQRQADKSGE